MTPDASPPPSPSRGVVALHTSSEYDWQPILQSSNQVVLYNPKSHALTISRASSHLSVHGKPCPYCKRVLPDGFGRDAPDDGSFNEADPTYQTREPDYFRLLAFANENASGLPPLTGHEEGGRGVHEEPSRAFPPNTMAEGYFKRFFKEEYKLGMGANGTVYLCHHMLDGNSLGHFAVKKIAVGESHTYLLNILREVRLLEQLHHPNIITYHHAWLETCQFSSFGPRVPTLHVLMQWAEGGSLDDFIDIRLGRGSPHVHINPFGTFFTPPQASTSTAPPNRPHSHVPSNDFAQVSSDIHSRSARIRAFRAYQQAPPEEKERMRRETLLPDDAGKKTQSLKAVHLLSADEVKSLFSDVAEGLNFLHGRSILHLDLKPGNVLLTWDEGRLIPRAMLSDFGTSRDMIASNPVRTGNTGTLEYSSPESLPAPQTGLLGEISSKSDMWSLGMILHKLLFFKLPYQYASDSDDEGQSSSGTQRPERTSRLGEAEKLKRLEHEVSSYPGFKSNSDFVTVFEARRLPRTFLILLEGLLSKAPSRRPSCERVSLALKEGKLDPLKEVPKRNGLTSLVPLARSLLDTSDRSPAPVPNSPTGSDVDFGGDPHRKASLPELPDSSGVAPKEKLPVLGLPSPVYALDSPNGKPNSAQQSGVRVRWTRKVLRTLIEHREPLVKLTKSSVLLAKAFSISTMCSSSYGFPRLLAASALTGAALTDAVVEMGTFGHIGLLAFHILVIKIGCAYGPRCL